MSELKVDLADAAKALTDRFSEIRDLYLFGSRRYRTGSTRSDIDILVTTGTAFIKPSDALAFTTAYNPAIDLFLVRGSEAVSVANNSFLQANSLDELVSRLDAVRFWSREVGIISNADIDLIQTTDDKVEFVASVLPDDSIDRLATEFAKIERVGLSVRPYIGATVENTATFICELIRRLVKPSLKLSPKGRGANGWTVRLNSEYEFQDLFWIVVKPWLPTLAREELAIIYDGQHKYADFSLFASSIIVEFKHVKDANTKAAVAKTLTGLSEFYRQNANVRVVAFAILVDSNVELDDSKWESEYSVTSTPSVKVVVVRNNP